MSNLGYIYHPATATNNGLMSAADKASFINMGLVSGLIADNTSAASANTAAIQAALGGATPGNVGRVSIVSATPITIYLNAPLVIGSNTDLYVSPNVTIRLAPGSNTNLLQNNCYANVAFATVTAAWTSGLEATFTWTAHGLAVGDWVWVQGTSGTTDGSYVGIFMVETVTDANTVVLALRRLPTAGPTGTLKAKKADVNITISGGIWDANYANNTGGTAFLLHIAILLGIHVLQVRDTIGTNAFKFFFCAGAIRDFDFSNIQATLGDSARSASDIVKVYGPSCDGRVRRISGDPFVDDGVSIQPQEPPTFAAYNVTGGGDCLNIAVQDVNVAYTQTSAVLTYSHPAWIMDGIAIENVSGHSTGNALVRIDVGVALTGGIVKSIKIKNVQWSDGIAEPCVAVTAGSQTIDRIEIDGVFSSGPIPSAMAAVQFLGGTIKSAIVRGVSITIGATNGFAVNVTGGTINTLSVTDCQVSGTGTFGSMVQLNGGTISKVVIARNYTKSLSSALVIAAGVTSNPAITFTDNELDGTSVGINTAASASVLVGGNLVTGSLTNGLVRGNGAAVVLNVASMGGNVGVPTGKWIVKVNGGETINLSAPDFRVDASTIARFDGGMVYNTNTALGTLGVAGLIVGQGTAAGSWHLMSDPTKSY